MDVLRKSLLRRNRWTMSDKPLDRSSLEICCHSDLLLTFISIDVIFLQHFRRDSLIVNRNDSLESHNRIDIVNEFEMITVYLSMLIN